MDEPASLRNPIAMASLTNYLGLLTKSSVVLVSVLVFFSAGLTFFSAKLFPVYEASKHRGVPFVFSTVVTLSILMVELVLFEILDILDAPWRVFLWKADVYVVLAMLIFFIPPYLTYLLVSKYIKMRRAAIGLTLVIFIFWMALFYLLGNPPKAIAIIRDAKHGPLSTEHLVSAVAVIGVTLSAVLSGFGAVNMIWSHFRTFLGWYNVSHIAPLQRKLAHITDRIELHRRRLASAEDELQLVRDSGQRPSVWVRSCCYRSGLRALQRMNCRQPSEEENLEKECTDLRLVIGTLQGIRNDMIAEINDLRQGAENNTPSNLGTVLRVCGYIFSCFVAGKLVMAAYNTWKRRSTSLDPVSWLLQAGLRLVDIRVNIRSVAQYSSFLLVGVIVTLQMRNFLNYVTKLIDPAQADPVLSSLTVPPRAAAITVSVADEKDPGTPGSQSQQNTPSHARSTLGLPFAFGGGGLTSKHMAVSVQSRLGHSSLQTGLGGSRPLTHSFSTPQLNMLYQSTSNTVPLLQPVRSLPQRSCETLCRPLPRVEPSTPPLASPRVLFGSLPSFSFSSVVPNATANGGSCSMQSPRPAPSRPRESAQPPAPERANDPELRRNSAILGLFLAEVMGMYFLTCVLLIRKNMPNQYRRVITRVLGEIEFDLFHYFFDLLFAGSAILCLLRMSLSRYRMSNTKLWQD